MDGLKKRDLDYFKRQFVAVLLEQARREEAGLKKSVAAMEKARGKKAAIGEEHVWNGVRYRKIREGKWRPVYQSDSRGARQAARYWAKQAAKCTSMEGLMKIALEHKQRFSDAAGIPLECVRELREAIDARGRALSESPDKEEAKMERVREVLKKPDGEIKDDLDAADFADRFARLVASGGGKGRSLPSPLGDVGVSPQSLKGWISRGGGWGVSPTVATITAPRAVFETTDGSRVFARSFLRGGKTFLCVAEARRDGNVAVSIGAGQNGLDAFKGRLRFARLVDAA